MIDKFGGYQVEDKNLSDLGKKINSVVQDAVNNMNFEQLNNQISSSINNAVNEVQKNLGIQNQNQNQRQNQRQNQNPQWKNRNQWGYQGERKSPSLHPAINKNPSGRVSSILYMIFGSAGLGISFLGLLSSILLFAWNGFFSQVANRGIIFFLITTVISSVLFVIGVTKRRAIKQFNRYVKTINNRNYCTIEELSFGSGKNQKNVIKDLRMMMRKGMFLEGHIDDEEKTFMLTYDVYQKYLDLKNNEQARILNQEKILQEKTAEEAREIDERVKAVVLEGEKYIAQIQAANVAIPGQEVSNQLDILENVIRKIFSHIEKHPEQVSEIRQFTQYYLPTTLKLVNTYKDLDGQSIQRDNITSAKLEIEKTLDTINLAFENLYDSLFENVAMDVTTDISVLETMLKREGLTEKDFN